MHTYKIMSKSPNEREMKSLIIKSILWCLRKSICTCFNGFPFSETLKALPVINNIWKILELILCDRNFYWKKNKTKLSTTLKSSLISDWWFSSNNISSINYLIPHQRIKTKHDTYSDIVFCMMYLKECAQEKL